VNTFVIEEFFVSDENQCNFYTVRFDDSTISETDKFYDDFFIEGQEFEEDIRIIDALIFEISKIGTKIIRRTQDEARALALPPELLTKESYIEILGNKLRLYYIQLAENVIVLLGGGIAHENQTGNPPIQFQEAQTFSKKILEVNNVLFKVAGGRLTSIGDEEIIIN